MQLIPREGLLERASGAVAPHPLHSCRAVVARHQDHRQTRPPHRDGAIDVLTGKLRQVHIEEYKIPLLGAVLAYFYGMHVEAKKYQSLDTVDVSTVVVVPEDLGVKVGAEAL